MQASGGPAQILLVEDSPGDIRLTEEALVDAKIINDLAIATDGEQALAMLRHEPPYEDVPEPDLILLDLNLPKVSGQEVLAEIRNDPKLKLLPVVVLTTSAADEDVLEAYRLNVNAYVQKPVAFNDFMSAVKSLEEFWLTIVRLPTRSDHAPRSVDDPG